MFKKSLPLVAALFVCFSLHAQRARNLSAGPVIGFNVSNIRGDISSNSSKIGLVAGGFFNYSIVEHFGISGQITYNQLGANFSNGQFANRLKLNYLNVPVLAVFYFGQGLRPGTVRPKLFIGPHANFLLAAKDKNGNKYPEINPVDFGATFGGGVNIALQNQRWINLDVRYGLGLSDIHKPTNTVWRNGAFSATLGISFPLGNYNESTGRIRR
jgi:hypothetical protein